MRSLKQTDILTGSIPKQLLEQRAEPDRQKEEQQLLGDAAGQNIRLF